MSSFALVFCSGFLSQAFQVLGALAMLAPFAATQLRVLTPQSRVYLLLNLAGSALLAVLAAVDAQYGFLLLEGAWALVSAWGLLSLARGRPAKHPLSTVRAHRIRRASPGDLGGRTYGGVAR